MKAKTATIVRFPRVIEVKGEVFGVRFRPRGKNDPHLELVLMVEDDGHWHEMVPFSNLWVGDLAAVIRGAKAAMEGMFKKDPKGPGYLHEIGPQARGSTWVR